MKIGFITKFPVPFFATMEDAAKEYAAANPGVEIVFGQGTSATDIEGQIALIESMVTQGVQGIAITPVDPTVAPALDRAIAAGVKVVLMDNDIPGWNGPTALATTDNYNAGKIAGEHLKSVLQDGGSNPVAVSYQFSAHGLPSPGVCRSRSSYSIHLTSLPGRAQRPSTKRLHSTGEYDYSPNYRSSLRVRGAPGTAREGRAAPRHAEFRTGVTRVAPTLRPTGTRTGLRLVARRKPAGGARYASAGGELEE